MSAGRRLVTIGLIAVALHLRSVGILAAAPASAPENPARVGLKESVRMNLVQLEVTVWPKDPGSDACLGLTADDLELLIDGKPQPIYAVDSLGIDQELLPEGVSPTVADGMGRGLSIVLFFDLYHLDLFYRGFPACPQTKPHAFDEARRFVKEEFHDGDRLLLVTAAGWPVVHYGWIRTQAEALRALDRLEKNNSVLMPRQEHVNHVGWIAGLESLFLALGRYPGRKDVIYLADDFRFDDVAMKMYEIAARAQSNSVVVHAVDLLDSCRKVPCQGGGLLCTDFMNPIALGPMSSETGGELFHTERIAAAVHELRATRKCRYVVSFRKQSPKGKRAPGVEVRLRGDRKGLSLLAPASFEPPGRAPTQADRNEALFLLPRFGRGIAARAAIWPFRYDARAKRWKTLVLARIERTDDEPWPPELHELTVNVLLHKASEIYGEYKKKITGPDLELLGAPDGAKLLLFPVGDIRPGETTVDLTVLSDDEDVSAKVRQSLDVPKGPGPGEARPWFLSDHQLRLAEKVVLAPSLDGVVTPEETPSFIGYACRAREGTTTAYSGTLVPFSGGPSVPVPIHWLEGAPDAKNTCGWLVGRAASPLTDGLWTFNPPADLDGPKAKTTAGVEFNVVSATPPGPSTALPAELKSK